MSSNKKTKKIIVFFCIIPFCIIIINNITVPKVELKSEDGKWRAIFFQENLCIENWDGMLVYEGSKEIDRIWAQTSYNGVMLYSQEKDGRLEPFHGHLPYRVQFALRINEEKPVFYSLVSFGDKPKEITVLIQWEENGKKYETTLEYSK